MRGGAPRSRSHSVFHLTPATAVGVQTIDDRSCCCSARRCFPISAAPLMVAHASSWTPESLSRTLPRRARGAPARLKPRGLLRIQDQPLDMPLLARPGPPPPAPPAPAALATCYRASPRGQGGFRAGRERPVGTPIRSRRGSPSISRRLPALGSSPLWEVDRRCLI